MPASGKTTLLRALARQIEPHGAVRDPGDRVRAQPAPAPASAAAAVRRGVPAPGRPSVDPATGRPAGEMTLSDLLHQTLRMSVTRVIVGEVRGAEALPMLEAMNAGMPGSMCTLHAGSAGGRVRAAGHRGDEGRRTRAGRTPSSPAWPRRASTTSCTCATSTPAGRRRGSSSEIAEVTDVTETGAVAMNRIFAPNAAAIRAAVPDWLPQTRAAVRRGRSRPGLPADTPRPGGWRPDDHAGYAS